MGLPVPRHELLLGLSPTMVAVVQERLPGQHLTVADVAAVDAVVALNDRFAGLLSGRHDVPAPRLNLARPADPVPAEFVAAHSERAGRVVRLVRAAGRSGGQPVRVDDLVHTDLTISNVLFDDEAEISGLIDWNYGVARGDLNYGLVKLLHTLSYAAISDQADVTPTKPALEHLEDLIIERLAPGLFRRYWAHQTLTMLYSSLRWGTPSAFDAYLELGEAGLS